MPLCEEHAEDRALPAAIDVERSLLATYQVERLPDEALDRIHDDRTEPPPARRASLALLAAIVILLAVGIARGTATYERRPTPVNVVAGPVSAARDTSGSYLPIQRRNNGVESPIWSRVLLLSPRSFDEPRCGKRTADGVHHVGCKDPAANVFIGAVIRRTDASGACPPETTVASRSGARTLCWRPLPTGGAGSGRTFLS